MRSFVLAVAIAFAALSSFAATTCKKYQTDHSNGLHATAAAACNASAASWLTPIPGGSWSLVSSTGGMCKWRNSYVFNDQSYTQDSQLAYTEVASDCQPDACSAKVGQSNIVNVTSGWKRSPKVDDSGEDWVITYRLPPSSMATLCGGPDICEMTIDGNEPCDECGAYVSQVPGANGMHRVSTDFRGHYTGKTCNASSTSDLPPESLQRDDLKDPPCPGYVGEVNGTKGCFGTADKPVRPVPAPTKPPAISSTDAGNPAAGTKPTSGEGSGTGGSGRTPSAGTGGSSGGPSGAASGSNGVTKPDGTAPKPPDGKEQAACGAPGQPKCGIDESGTPSKFEGKGDLLSGWEEGVKTNRATIEKSGTGIFESFSVFFSAPPLAGCEPIELPHDQVITRHCDVVDGTRSVMAYIWALTALWLCVGWIREAI